MTRSEGNLYIFALIIIGMAIAVVGITCLIDSTMVQSFNNIIHAINSVTSRS